ncbi:MAG: thioredoxin [Eubacterium sp.]|nr:thioredoxin [Eubacterium sp.]
MAVLEINETNFDEIIKTNDTVLVDFYAVWCGPCKMMAPIVDEIAAENPDVTVGKCDVDEAEELAVRFGIMSIPTLMVFKGGEAVKTFVGVQSKDAILGAIK